MRDQIKAGYKQLDIGIIPEDWDEVLIGDIFEFKNGLNKAKEFFGYGTPIVNYMDVFKFSGLRLDNVQGKVHVSFREKQNFSVKKRDVFFTRTSETVADIGIASVMLEDCHETVFSGFLLRARPKSQIVNEDFCKYCFASFEVRKQITSKSTYTTRALTNGRLLSSVILPLPKLEEQIHIAEALSDVENLINSLDLLIKKKRDMKTATMQKLLTGKQRLFGFDDKWEEYKIKDFTHCVAGGTPSTLNDKYWNGEILWMSSGELNNKFIHNVVGRITETGLKNSSTSLVPEKCVLIGLAGQGKTRGTAAINFISLCTNQSIAAIFPSYKHCSLYLYYNLESRYSELREISSGGGGRGGLNLSIINNLVIPFPRLKEQKAISQVLYDIDIEIDLLEQRLAKTKSLKTGMMQELLTGKTRLNKTYEYKEVTL